MLFNSSQLLIDTLRQRRQKLSYLIDFPAILWSGCASPRNFPANIYPFRASSHFLYFAGFPLENAVIRLYEGCLELFMDDAPPGSALWHGEIPQRNQIAELMGADFSYPLSELSNHLEDAATIVVQNPITANEQRQLLNCPLRSAKEPEGIDLELTQAIIYLRLTHDQLGLQELRQAAEVSIQAHKQGMKVTKTAQLEAEIRAAMEGVIIGNNMTCSYNSIVTVQGEVLHNQHYHHALQAGDLLLADVGAETAMGWAADITRTWPVSGKFSPTQRDIYQVVLNAHDTCINHIKPGIEYQEIHQIAAIIIAEGLGDLGILKGNPEDLVEQDAHALFFPHGIGHLLGLDVHDMEDLGDLAGYEPGRVRSQRFGWCFLRLNRPLKPRMLVTIEPGFYQVPAILNDPKNRETYQKIVNWERLEQFADVRGIRIEDDVLVTETGTEVLTQSLPTSIQDIEALVNN